MKLCFLAILLLCFSAFAVPDYQIPFQIEAGGSPIQLGLGHANPLVTDWDGDGKKDLIVGQYTGAKLRCYINSGSNDAPEFTTFSYMQADGSDISLTSG